MQLKTVTYESAVVTWQNGDKQPFFGEDAASLIIAWSEAVTLLSERTGNHRLKNRRDFS